MKPYDKGYISVSDGHRLYYERIGNKKGVPAVFLHGGPGTGVVESHKELFDFKKFNVLFFDQRGAGKSKPYGSLKANTTWKLVDDIVFLMNRFGIEKAVFHGGSWGSTLGLVFAILHPERVLGLVLRGIYLSNKAGSEYYLGGGVGQFAPKEWERFVSLVPPKHRNDIMGYYSRQMHSAHRQIRRKYCYEWSRYEMSIVALHVDEKDMDKMLAEYSYESLALLECHYIAKDCFLPPNFILRNAAKLSKFPVSIIHGRYDLICRPVEAWQLHKKIKGSRLFMVISGHSASEPAMKRTIIRELSRMATMLSRS